MIAGPSVDRHHWIPRRRGGQAWSWLHTVCHRKIHALFDERTLARRYPTAEALKEVPEMRAFLAWVRKKPPDFLDWHKSPRRGR